MEVPKDFDIANMKIVCVERPPEFLHVTRKKKIVKTNNSKVTRIHGVECEKIRWDDEEAIDKVFEEFLIYGEKK